MDELRWGILATGAIARAFARDLHTAESGRLVAVGSRTEEKARKLASGFEGVTPHGSYEALLADKEVDAVYVATPHPQHAQWVIRAAESGKHVLCEKPLGVNHAEVMAMVEAARVNDVFLMEAFMYRVHPQTLRLVELLRQAAIGEVRHIRSSFGFASPFNAESRLFRNDLAGGGILDVGCYAISVARLVAGVARGEPFAEPDGVAGHGQLGETGIDRWAAGLLSFPGGVSAQVASAVSVDLGADLEIYGSRGRIRVSSPFLPSGRGRGPWEIRLDVRGESPQVIRGETSAGMYAIEADHVAEQIAAGRRESPLMSLDDSLGNARALDAWRRAIPLVYETEQPERCTVPASGRPLERRSDAPMRYAELPGVTVPISRLVLGVDNQSSMPQAAVMFDHYFEHGGNAFDTAYLYGGGLSESLLGQWIRNRGVRDDVVVITKGAHTPLNFPRYVEPQLLQSLERLQTDSVDLYFLHRDNEDVPAGEFVAALNEQLRAGRIRAFGGSNWTAKRVREANEYARTHGMQGFVGVSNNFSLARMLDPVWAGCVASSEPEYRDFLEESGLALLPWGSQARGFFTPRADVAAAGRRESGLEAQSWGHPDLDEMVRVWFSDDNLERRRRAGLLAEERGVERINVALAYVLCQPFPVFALIGPRAPWETRSCLRALEIELSRDELLWLDLQSAER